MLVDIRLDCGDDRNVVLSVYVRYYPTFLSSPEPHLPIVSVVVDSLANKASKCRL